MDAADFPLWDMLSQCYTYIDKRKRTQQENEDHTGRYDDITSDVSPDDCS